MPRPRKPTSLRLLEGNPGKRRIPAEPTAPEPGLPTEVPEGLSGPARAVWDELGPELEAKGLLRPRYVFTFEVFCEAVAAWRRAAELVAQGGPLILRDGTLVSNPACREFNRFSHLVRSFGSDFGLSPAAVTSLSRPPEPKAPGLGPNGSSARAAAGAPRRPSDDRTVPSASASAPDPAPALR